MELRHYASAVAAFAAVLYVALTIAVFGVLSLLLERDVVGDPNAGQLTGPIEIACATAVLFFWLLARALSRRVEHRRIAPLGALLLGFCAYVAYVVSGGVAASVAEPGDFIAFALGQAIGPFGTSAGAIAFVVALLEMIVLASRADERGRPRWPWEKHDSDD